MDANACLERIIYAAQSGDADEIEEAAHDLAEWLRKGGAPANNPFKAHNG